MNEPLISPLLIYLIGRLNILQGFSCVLAFLLTIFMVVMCVIIITGDNTDNLFLNRFKKFVYVTLVVDALAFFMPTRTEVIAMYTATYITPANIKTTGDFAEKTVDKLIEKILKASEVVKESDKNDQKFNS